MHPALIGLGTGGLILMGIDPSFELPYLAVFGLFALLALILRPSMKRREQRLATAKAANEDVVAAFRRRDDW